MAAILAEYGQLRDTDTLRVLKAGSLSKAQKEGALELLTLIKKKRCGKIKGRVCANGRKQRKYIRKEDVSSPTVRLESILATLAVDAKEKRVVATADVAGAYLQTVMTDFVIVKLSGPSVKIMCDVMPSFKPKVSIEKGKEVLYMRLHKALYGCVQVQDLCWETKTNGVYTQQV